ncbi:MAG: prepilin-type cleavage/methylation domain-containing protein [Candidatus Methylomirabilales bacterium]
MYHGFTIIEVTIAAALLVTLGGIAIPVYKDALHRARIARAIGEISMISKEIEVHQVYKGNLPNTLAGVDRGDLLDPWGNPYEYLNIAAAGKGVAGKARKDKFLVPLNSDYDLYSKGKDGQSVAPLTAQASWDDIVRANDGAYIGLALEY